MSGQVNELFGALAKAQIELKSIPFDSKNPHFRNEFASLQAIQDGTRPILGKHGLSITQDIWSEGDIYYLMTTLGHSSGQFKQSTIKLLMVKNDMQAMGSASTYAKRYAWQAIVGVAGDKDDDGEASVGRDSPQPVKPQSQASMKPKAVVNPDKGPPKNLAPADRAQFSRISSLMQERAISDEVFQKYLKDVKGGMNSKTMTRSDAQDLIEMLEDSECTEGFLMSEVARKMK